MTESRSTQKRGAIFEAPDSWSASNRAASRSSRTAQPEIADLFARALALESHGRDDEAQVAYIEVIRRDGTHFEALIRLGNLLNRRGYRRAARLTYAEAAKAAPGNPIVAVNLGNTFLDSGELDRAREHFERALRLDPQLPEAHQGMSYVFARQGDEAAAARHRDRGFAHRAVTAFPYRGTNRPVRATLLVSALGGNIGTGDFLDDWTFAVTRIFVEYAPDRPLPETDVVFNAIGDADRCGAALATAERLLEGTRAAVINRPRAILATRRADAAKTLSGISGIRTAKAAIVERAALTAMPQETLEREGFEAPVLLRSLGFHAGMFFERAEDMHQVREAAAKLPGDDVAVIELLDTRGADGKHRKYRVMFIDGELLPLHLAISSDWKVHYFTAGMSDNAAHQAEERRFLSDMPATIGSHAVGALREIAARLRLEYAGVDFGLDAGGSVLVFEANATMIVPSREVDERLAYRRPYLERALEAVRGMVLRKAEPPRANG